MGTFSTQPDSEACELWKDCLPGSRVKLEGTAETDRECEPCPEGETTTGNNYSKCNPIGECQAGTVAISDAGSDCQPCAPGTYCEGGHTPPVACVDGTWDHDTNPATVCQPWKHCVPGEHFVAAGSALEDVTCATCDSGTFSDMQDAPVCTDWKGCAAGEYIAQEGDVRTDRSCAPCATGSFSSQANATQCELWATCAAPSKYATLEPSAVRDRECGDCTQPNVTAEDNETACALHAFQMQNGLVAIEAEHYFRTYAADEHAWTSVQDGNASGGACVELGPNVGTDWVADPDAGPQLEYRITFNTGGSYFIHVRADASVVSPALSDSCYVSLDSGQPVQYTYNAPNGTWGWASSNVMVPSAGLHTLTIYGREDGLRVDRIVISTATDPPSGAGPAESPRIP